MLHSGTWKRITAVVIALVLVCGMFGNAFADDIAETGQETETVIEIQEGPTEEPEIPDIESAAEDSGDQDVIIDEETSQETPEEETEEITEPETGEDLTGETPETGEEITTGNNSEETTDPVSEESEEETEIVKDKNNSMTLLWDSSKYEDYAAGNAVVNATIDYNVGAGKRFLLYFAPEKSGRLTVRSSSNEDTYGQLLDSGKTELIHDDDSAGNSDFYYQYTVDPGEYYIAFSFYYTVDTGIINISIVYDELDTQNEGWVQAGDQWFYYKLNGGNLEPVKSDWLHLGNYWYYFDADGVMFANTVKLINGAYYGFDEKGHMVKGWHDFGNGRWYYFYSNGSGADGLTTVNGKRYYFRFDGEMLTDREIEDAINNRIIVIGSNGVVTDIIPIKAGWVRAGNDWYYYEDFGYGLQSVSNDWRELGGYRYYFGDDGRMYSDGLYYIYGWYAFDANGHMLTGWYNDGLFWYYLGSGGAAVYGLRTINDKRYYFDYNGRMLTSQNVISNTSLIAIGKNGVVTEAVFADTDGWKDFCGGRYYAREGQFVRNTIHGIGEYTYGFDSEGRMYCDEVVEKYYGSAWTNLGFDRQGHMVKGGWLQPSGGNGWYYFGSDGAGVSGLKTISSQKYYFVKGRMVVSEKLVIDGTLYVIDAKGHVTAYSGVTNGWINNTFYMKDGSLAQGWITINGSRYYFNDGMFVRNDTCYVKDDDAWYRFDTAGAMRTGWIPVGESWMYADSTGALAVDDWFTIGGKQYYFDGFIAVTDIYDNGGELYLFNSNGSFKEAISGAQKWVKNDKYWYYIKAGGWVAQNEILTINGEQYCFDNNGRMLTDYQSDYSYYGSNGKTVKNAWVEVKAKWYYYDATGTKVKNSWKQIGSSKYYFDGGGAMVIGEYVIDDIVYNFGSNGKWDGKSGRSLKSGWLLADGSYYYYEDGELAYGVRVINGKAYCFASNGRMVCNTIYSYNGASYAFGENGAMIKNAWYKDTDGQWYYAGSDGKLAGGYTSVNGKYYYFSEVFPNMMLTASILKDNVYYDITSNGAVNSRITPSGTKWVKTSAGKWLYSADGVFVTGMRSVNGATYYFDENSGEMVTNQLVGNFYVFGRYCGYCGSNGKMVTEGWVRDPDGLWFYLVDGAPLFGSHYIDGKWYYLNGYNYDPGTGDGIYYVDGSFYKYAGSSGGRTKLSFGQGWNKYGSDWYYVVGTALVKSTVRKIGSKYYLFDSDGRWVTTEEAVYYSGTKFLQKDGTFLKNGWKKIDGTWYYFGPDGNVWTGVRTIDGKTYHLTAPVNKYVELG